MKVIELPEDFDFIEALDSMVGSCLGHIAQTRINGRIVIVADTWGHAYVFEKWLEMITGKEVNHEED